MAHEKGNQEEATRASRGDTGGVVRFNSGDHRGHVRGGAPRWAAAGRIGCARQWPA